MDNRSTAERDRKILGLIRNGMPPEKVARAIHARNVWTIYNAIRRFRCKNNIGRFSYVKI